MSSEEAEYLAARIADLVRHAEAADRTTRDVTFEAYRQDQTLILATERSVQLIGESVKRIGESAYARWFDAVPFHVVRNMRNMLVHRYDRIDQTKVYAAARSCAELAD